MNPTEHYDSFQEFLDQQQYSKKGVKRYEWIFGKTFLSTGGLETTKKFLSTLHLKSGEEVLDVGCGLGGHDFYMAETYDVNVLGIDLSVNMMSLALEHLSQRPHLANKVRLDVCDITQANYEQNSFHVIYSRDTLLHIGDKEKLFGNFMRWLKPGGRILFSDYSRGDKDHSEEFKRYVAQRGYHLLTTEEYHQLLVDTGFVAIKAEDETEEFLKALQKELNKLRNQKETFLKEFSEEDYRYLEEGWTSKIRRVADGDQTWTVCYAEKRKQ